MDGYTQVDSPCQEGDGVVTFSREKRQLRFQTRALEAVTNDPALLDDADLRRRLDHIANGVKGELYEQCIDEWRKLLREGEVGAIVDALMADTDEGARMRATSPPRNFPHRRTAP